MKKSLLILLLFAGIAGADEISTSTIYGKADFDSIEPFVQTELDFHISLKKIVQDNLCPSGWKDSEWFLEHSYTQKEIDCRALLYTNCEHEVQPVQICPDNGIIRVKPQ